MASVIYEIQPGPRPAPLRRTLHLLDLENLLGDPCASDLEVAHAIAAYRATAGVGPRDHAVVATNGRLALAAGLAWPGALLRIGRGRDGADLALLREVTTADVARRFPAVILGSGDAIFADTVRDLQGLGIQVVVIGRRGSISASLYRLTEVRHLCLAGTTATHGQDPSLPEVA